MPFWNLTPWTTFGNWFSPFNRRQVFAAAVTSLNTMSLAVFADKDPLVRTVRWRTVANTLSIGIDVRRWSQCSAGKSKKASMASRSLVRQATAFSYLAAYLSANTSIAVSAAASYAGDWVTRSIRRRDEPAFQ